MGLMAAFDLGRLSRLEWGLTVVCVQIVDFAEETGVELVFGLNAATRADGGNPPPAVLPSRRAPHVPPILGRASGGTSE